MKKSLYLFFFIAELLIAQHSTTIGRIVYQNQAFSSKDKEIFDSDGAGSRVWDWSQARIYCEGLRLDGYGGWSVASRRELQALMIKSPKSSGLSVHPKFVHTMPKVGGKYDDVWMWTRDEKSSKIGAFVNFKKAKIGWAEKQYKGYVICTKKAGDDKKKSKLSKLKKATLFEYDGKVWRSDMSLKGTYPLGDYGLSHFRVCSIIPIVEGREVRNAEGHCSDDPSGFVQFGRYSYFFGHKGSSKAVNIYRTDGTKKGTKKIASLGKKVAYMPVVVSRYLYFMRSSYVPFQTEPPDRELWVVDMKRTTVKEVAKLHMDTSIENSRFFDMYASSKKHLFLRGYNYDERSKTNYKELWIVDTSSKGIRKLKQFKEKIPQNLHSIKVDGVTNKLTKIPNNSSFGWERFVPKGYFTIKGKYLYHGKKKIVELPKIKDMDISKATIVYNGIKETILESSGALWGIDTKAEVVRLR